MKFRVQFIGFLSFVLWLSPLLAQENERSLLKEIEKVKKEIEAEKELENQEMERDKLFRERAEARKVDIGSQLRTLKTQTDSIKAQVQSLEKSNKKIAGASRHFESQRQKFAQSLAVLLDRLATEIEKGFPFEAKLHSEILTSAASGLRSGAVTPEEGLTRSWSVMSTRLRKSLESELYSGVFAQRSGDLSGTYLRFGLALSFFKSQDEQVMKYYDVHQAQWRDVPEDLEMRRRFKEIFEVMEGKAPPSLVDLPLWILAQGGES